MAKTKRYVIYETTLNDVARIQRGDGQKHNAKADTWGNIIVKELSFPRVGLSELQQERQEQSRYIAKQRVFLDWNHCEIEDVVEKKLWEIAQSKYRGDLSQKIEEEMGKTKVAAQVYIDPAYDDSYEYVIVSCSGKLMTTDEELQNNFREEEESVSYDEKELRTILEKARVPTRGPRSDDRYVYIESVSVQITTAPGAYSDKFMVDSLVRKAIKKEMSALLAYCLRNGKLIVPDEYLERGEKGIRDWQKLQRSKNAKNSMEKRMITQLVRAKKNYLKSSIDTVHRAVEENSSWTMPTLKIDGRWNNGKCKKLSSTLIKGKTNQDLLAMGDEELLALAKEYWKAKLMEAYNNVDKLTTKKKG